MAFFKHHPVLILLTSIFCANCGVKEISLDFPEHTSKPVINSIIKKDSIISLTINTSEPVLEKENTTITNATVILLEDESIIDSLLYSNGQYNSNTIAKTNSIYQIIASISGYEELSAQDQVPSLPIILASSFKDSVYLDDDDEYMSQLTITLQDPPDINNFYELKLGFKYKGSPESGTIFSDVVFYDYINNDLVLQNEGQLDLDNFVHPVFSDALFDGTTYTLRINYEPDYSIYVEGEDIDTNYDLIVILRSISETYYEYRKSLTIHLDNQLGGIWEGVGQPTEMYSNIKNGYGVFAAYSQVIDTLQKE
ncbi:hypothetical protein MNBD_BACTEROID03-2706 [hydrothermal vent metagenome]|uniref:DUF4249 domain-containing protein n=1 Tax=hydrothermal vent metagenome TaxID=652676 RepID=A0A3B0TT21_9ZZZZ